MKKELSNSSLSLIVGIFLAIFILYFTAPLNNSNQKFEDLALGEDTKNVIGKVDGIKIHCHNLTDYEDCLIDYSKHGDNEKITLWLGNSQLHAINDYRDGQKTSPMIFFKKAKKQKQYVLSLSQPNANLQEHLILTAHLVEKLPIEYLILPIVFDDLREDGIRENLKGILEDQDALKLIKSSKIGKNIISNNIKNDNSGNNVQKSNLSIQDKSESILNNRLEEMWSLWNKRSDLRGDIYNSLYRLRNYIFQIDPTTIRKMLPGQYSKNLNALKALLELTNKNNIKTLIYIVPIRNDIKIPYDIDEYMKFKKEVDQIASSKNIRFKNLENLIPSNMWGKKGSTTVKNKDEIDFMHFKSDGHRLLAEKIFTEMNKIWINN